MRIVLLHGFGQTGRCLGPLEPALAAHAEVLTPSLPGHAGEPFAGGGFLAEAAALAERMGRASYFGYSMGGRLALGAALERPELVERLVVLGASPGIEADSARAERQAEEARWAHDLETQGLDAFFERWLAGPLFQTLPPAAHFREERRRSTVPGLQRALAELGTGAQPALLGRLHKLAPPTLFLAGALDARFVMQAEKMAERAPQGRVELIPDAGHAAHLERPEWVAAAVFRHLG